MIRAKRPFWLLALLPFLIFAQSSQAIEVSFESDSSLPMVYLNVAVKAGSVTDPAGQGGISNFMGEMLLRGTKQRTKELIDLELDQMGAKLDVEVRAEALIVRGAVLADQLDRFLALVSEVLTQPNFPEGEIRKLKQQVISQIAEELGRDQTLASRRFQKFLFHGHPYGKPVLGTTKEIERLTRAQILSHYNRLIRDSLFLVVGTGDAKADHILEWSRKLAAARTGDGQTEIAKVAKTEDAPTRRLLIVDKPGVTQNQIYAGQIGVRMTDPDFFPLYLANHAFGGGSFQARLMTEVRVKRGWSYGAYSSFRHGLQPRSWNLYLFPASKDAPPALELSLKMVEDIKKGGITADEFSFSRDSLVNSAGFMYNTPKKRVENKLLERTLDLPDDFMKSYAANLQKVKIEEANAAMAKFLKPDHLAITVLASAKEQKDALAKAAGVKPEQVTVTPYQQE